MDKRKILLLKYLSKQCNENYKVLECGTILKSIKSYKNNFELLKKDMNYLNQYKYIDLKYIDQDNVCLIIKDNSRIIQENLKIESSTNKKMFYFLLLFSILSGVSSSLCKQALIKLLYFHLAFSASGKYKVL